MSPWTKLTAALEQPRPELSAKSMKILLDDEHPAVILGDKSSTVAPR
jgi:hypothetical protein